MGSENHRFRREQEPYIIQGGDKNSPKVESFNSNKI